MKNLLINFIHSQNNANSINVNVPFGRYSGIIIRKAGVHTTTVSETDITDNIVVNVAGVQRVNASMFSLINLNKFSEGYLPETTGTTFEFNVYIPVEFISSNESPAGVLINNIFAGATSNEISIYGVMSLNEIYSSETISEFSKTSSTKELFELDSARVLYLYSPTPSSFTNVEVIDSETNEILVSAPYSVVKIVSDIFTNSVGAVNGVMIDIGQYRKVKLIITSSTSHTYKVLSVGMKL